MTSAGDLTVERRRCVAAAGAETPDEPQTPRSRAPATASERVCTVFVVASSRRVAGVRSLAGSRAGHVRAPACPRGFNGRRRRFRSRRVHDHKPLLQEESVDTGRLLHL